MALPFPSLPLFQALQQRTKDARDRFEKLGYCDTRFGVKVDDALYTVAFEIYECVGVAEGGDPAELDFVLAGPAPVWREMLEGIRAHDGADAAHTLNTLTHQGDVMEVQYQDAEGHDRFYRYMASIQEFFDQSRHLDLEFE